MAIDFDGDVGPGGGSSQTSSWLLSAGAIAASSFNATEFLPSLGLPLVNNVSSDYDSIPIGTGLGQFNPAKFHGNQFNLFTNYGGSGPRGTFAGGNAGSGANAGRFSMTLRLPPTYAYYYPQVHKSTAMRAQESSPRRDHIGVSSPSKGS